MSANQQSALAALRTVAPIAARLEGSRDGEDRAADILELWQGTETALRALMGGASLGGQALIRELRQQELISLGQAYSLLEFLGARDRANRASYRPSDNDVAVAREGYHQLEAGLASGLGAAEAPPLPPRQSEAGAVASGVTSPYAPGASSYDPSGSSPYAPGASRAAPGPVTPPATYATPIEPAPGYASTGTRMPANFWYVIGVLAIIIIAVGGYLVLGKRGNPAKDMEQAATMMQTGQHEAARTEFARIARENPTLADPHVFLARLARQDGDIQTARAQLDSAIRLEPKNPKALREMGLILFSTGDYELARRFFVRSVQQDPADKASQGYLGCALARLNRLEEANVFLTRAGPGVWSSCTQRPL